MSSNRWNPSVSDNPLIVGGFPTVIDNSSLDLLVKCPHLYFRQSIQGLQVRGVDNDHLHFGGAYAHGLEKLRTEFYSSGRSEEEALIAALIAATQFFGYHEPTSGAKSAEKKTWEGLMRLLIGYTKRFPLATEAFQPAWIAGRRMIEFNFVVPLPFRHPVTGDNVLYTGRMDMIAENRHGQLFVEDDKTTSQLGAGWANQWDLSSQFSGYVYGAQQFDIPVVGALIRGNCLYADGRVEQQEYVTYRQPWQLEQWLERTLYQLQTAEHHWQLYNETQNPRTWPQALNHACVGMGRCVFHDICNSDEPDRWIQTNFERRWWNPIERKMVNGTDVGG